MNTLMIGGSSFVGAYSIEELYSKGNFRGGVVATGRNPKFKKYYESLGIPYFNVDICDKKSFNQLNDYQFDAAVLFAALIPANVPRGENADDDTADYYNVNVIGTLNALEYCRKHNIKKLISFGTRFDCRLYDQDTVITEETPLKFSFTDDHAAYVMSSNAKWDVMRYYNEKYGMNNIYLRLPTIFGLGPHGGFCKDGVYRKSGLQIFMDKAAVGEKIEVFGAPDTQKDLLYVKDLAIGVRQAIEAEGKSGFYNIGYDKNFRLFDVANAIADVFATNGKRSEVIQRTDIPNNGGFPVMDITKIKRDLGFSPRYYDIHAIFEDYKKELDRGLYSKLFAKE